MSNFKSKGPERRLEFSEFQSQSDYGGDHAEHKQPNPPMCVGVPPTSVWPGGATPDAGIAWGEPRQNKTPSIKEKWL